MVYLPLEGLPRPSRTEKRPTVHSQLVQKYRTRKTRMMLPTMPAPRIVEELLPRGAPIPASAVSATTGTAEVEGDALGGRLDVGVPLGTLAPSLGEGGGDGDAESEPVGGGVGVPDGVPEAATGITHVEGAKPARGPVAGVPAMSKMTSLPSMALAPMTPPREPLS